MKLSTTARQRLINLSDDALKKWNYNGAIIIAHDGEIIFERAYGMASFEEHIPNATHTSFNIASVTKQFTAACMMVLYEKGWLDLDDTLDQYLPSYTHASQITLRQLLNMSSGVPDYINDVMAKQQEEDEKKTELSEKDYYIHCQKSDALYYSTDTVLNLVNDLPLLFTPGEKVYYSNTNYVLLDCVIEKVSGKTFPDAMRDYLFEPLGMQKTCIGSQHAEAYSYEIIDDERVLMGKGEISRGDGGMVSTVQDLTIWLQAILAGRLLQQSSWDEVFNLYNDEYGFGWEKYEDFYYHDGANLGYESQVFISLDKKITIASTANKPTSVRGSETIYYKFNVTNSETGFVKMHLLKIKPTAIFKIHTIDIYEEGAHKPLVSIGRETNEEGVLWSYQHENDNDSELTVDESNNIELGEKVFYSLDIKKALGNKFNPKMTCRIEVGVSASDYTVIRSSIERVGQPWEAVMGMYLGVDGIFERLTKVVNDAFTFQ